MVTPRDDGFVLVFAPGIDNAGMIVRKLREAGLPCLVCVDAEELDTRLSGPSEDLAAVVVTAMGVRKGAGPPIARFKAGEPTWSALPIILLAPPGAVDLAPWPHTTLLTQPTTAKQLIEVVKRSVESRGLQHLLASASQDLRRIALQDPLTGLPNRTALYERMRTLQHERRGSHGGFSAIFVDLNDFKRINDDHGHAVGDEVLQQVSAHLIAAIRSTDYVARWGGDEFVVLLVGTTGTGLVADTVRRLGEGADLHLPSLPDPIRVSFSVGRLDDIEPEQAPEEILAVADGRMYEHKRAQRRQSDR